MVVHNPVRIYLQKETLSEQRGAVQLVLNLRNSLMLPKNAFASQVLPVCTENLNPDIVMMKPAKVGV